MNKRVTTRERVLLCFGVILAVLFGTALAIRNDQISAFETLAAQTLENRRTAVDSALKLSNAEASNVLNRSQYGGNPESWLSPVDPELVSAWVTPTSVTTSNSKTSITLTETQIREFANLSGKRKISASAFVDRIPVEYWAVERAKGIAVVARVWDNSRKARFARLANCEVSYQAGKQGGLISSSDTADFRRTLSDNAGNAIGSLHFHVFAKEYTEGQENANQSAATLMAASVGAFGILFVLLHRKIFEPMRIIHTALENQSIEPNHLQVTNPDEFGQMMQQLQRVFVQKHILNSANEELERVVRLRTRDLEEAYDSTIIGFSLAMELRDKETDGHCRRVAGMAVRLAFMAGLPSDEINLIHRGALLHDVGKLGIPDSILLKEGPLTPDEFHLMKKHTLFGYEMLKPIPFLQNCLDICLYHHEKWDGSGYPAGLKGEEIPLSARIFAFADVYDALRSDRPYRKGIPDAEIKQYIADQAGKHFDPKLAEIFAQMDCNDFWTDLEAASKRDEVFFKADEDVFILPRSA